jgi:mono/diheme cytochrome c family protein
MKGRPDTEVAKVLDPPPRNLADPLAMARVDDGRMYAAIKLGRAGTAMGSWNVLLDAVEIIDVIRYVRTLEQPLPIGMKKEDVDAEVGGQIYRRYCVSCHGAQGKANTPLARTLKPTPRDLTTRAMRARTELSMRHAIAAGIPGSAMAPWRGILSLQDIQRVVRYIRRTLQRPPA